VQRIQDALAPSPPALPRTIPGEREWLT